jgi:hypothetical protein
VANHLSSKKPDVTRAALPGKWISFQIQPGLRTANGKYAYRVFMKRRRAPFGTRRRLKEKSG